MNGRGSVGLVSDSRSQVPLPSSHHCWVPTGNLVRNRNGWLLPIDTPVLLLDLRGPLR